MGGLNTTPNAARLHIGVFGKTNSGKSSLVNILTGQATSIVSDVAGTTTDVVYKAMEISPLGPCVIMDTAGLDDNTALGGKRLEKTALAMEKTDLGIVVFAADGRYELVDGTTDMAAELELVEKFCQKNIPVLCLVNVFNNDVESAEALASILEDMGKGRLLKILPLDCSHARLDAVGRLREALSELVPEDYDQEDITRGLVAEEDVVLLVMPQDIQAPRRRLILPQVQTIRELLDKKCIAVCTSTDKLPKALSALKSPPKLIITDSQVFRYVYGQKPEESMLTSFSVLFAAYKGDLPYYIEGARHIDSLTADSRVLIAECCTHAPLKEDIGREKIPRLLRSRFGENLRVDVVSGTDFPEDLLDYDLVIQCGGCMFNRRYVMARIDKARRQNVPMTNYGITIAHLTGILDKISY